MGFFSTITCEMPRFSKIATALLLALTVAVLILNVHFLYVAPIPNTWTWWPGDETWLMAQYKSFIHTGHYINPLAPGSVFAESSGLIFGSCYLTALLYGIPTLFVHGHTIELGRTITFLLSILTLAVLWLLGRRYNVSPAIRAFGTLLLASTICFFATSHSARSDMLIGLSMLLIAGLAPFWFENVRGHRDILLGALVPVTVLVNGHVLTLSIALFGYLAWTSGILTSGKSLLRSAISALVGLGILLVVQWILLGSISITGPFTDTNSTMPFARLLHPRAHFTNYYWRLFIAEMWAPGVLLVFAILLIAVIWARLRYTVTAVHLEGAQRRFLSSTALVLLASIYIEYYWPRSFIYVLPVIVLTFMIVISNLHKIFSTQARIVFAGMLTAALLFALWRYDVDATKMGSAGEIITSANKNAVAEALATIHSRHSGRPRIFSTVPGQAVVMDDSSDLLTPVMYDWPSNKTQSHAAIWKSAHIDYAIVCNQARGNDRGEADSSIDWLFRSNARLIFQCMGPFSDIDRPYDPSNLKLLDTLRVYEFH